MELQYIIKMKQHLKAYKGWTLWVFTDNNGKVKRYYGYNDKVKFNVEINTQLNLKPKGEDK